MSAVVGLNNANIAEAAVVGGALNNPARLTQTRLTPEDFTDADYRAIWRVMLALLARGEPVDLVSIGHQLNSMGHENAATQAFLLMDASHDANFDAYAALVERAARRQRAQDIARQIMAAPDDEKLDGVVSDSAASLLALMGGNRRYQHTLNDALQGATELLEAANDRGGKVEISTGLSLLDRVLGGWHRQDLIIVGGRPACGKTAFALGCAMEANVPVGVISAEQPNSQLGQRWMAQRGRVSLEAMRTAGLTEQDYSRLFAAAGEMNASRQIFINDEPGQNIGGVVAQARQWKAQHGIGALFVDYLQRIQGPRSEKRHESVGAVAVALKNIARELNIPVIALAQVKREVESRTNKRPAMGDLSDSSDLEKEADQIITLYRDEVYNPESSDAGIAELSICKNRHGSTGLVRVAWHGAYTKFDDLYTHGDEQ